MIAYCYTLNLQVQGQTLDDLIRTMDEIKDQISSGYAMANEKDDNRRYALSIEDEELIKAKCTHDPDIE